MRIKSARPSSNQGEEYHSSSDEEEKAEDTSTRTALLSTLSHREVKTMVLSSRGISYRHRHLMMDIVQLLPNTKKDNKFDTKSELRYLNELCELNGCQAVIYFESRKREDLYLWLARTPQGPTIKFHVLNVHTMDELHFTGNCMQGTRPVLSFDAHFDARLEYRMAKEMLTQIFGMPLGHKKAKPYYDRLFQFSIVDDKIWFRHYQIVASEGNENVDLVEIGPRFVLNLMRIFESSFGGKTLAINASFVSPNSIRSMMKKRTAHKYIQRLASEECKEERWRAAGLPEDELSQVFH